MRLICLLMESRLLKHFPDGSFGLCILDIMMPEMDGITLAKEIRQTKSQNSDYFSYSKKPERRYY